jgi:DNA polymerase III subunit epsilon
MNFVAIDVETANEDFSSICQIGIAKYSNGQIIDEWCTLIDPEDSFSPINTSIHGISENDVKEAPNFLSVAPKLRDFLKDSISVCHTHFDRVAIARACERHNIPSFNTTWLDSARIARRTWKEFSQSGYGLANICAHLGYEFKHHDALEDAKASGHIVLMAVQETGLSIDDWLKRVEQPIKQNSQNYNREGNPEGALYGEIVCFTGALEITRSEAADLAASVGCNVTSGVTRKTTILVVGDQDLQKLAGHKKSSKHRKAEDMMLKGFHIRIINESDFKKIVKHALAN